MHASARGGATELIGDPALGRRGIALALRFSVVIGTLALRGRDGRRRRGGDCGWCSRVLLLPS
jgi:hypothetical protein